MPSSRRSKSHPSPQESSPAGRSASPNHLRVRVAILVAGLLLVGGSLVLADWWHHLPEDTPARYVGRQSCVECHAKQAAEFLGSDHDLAMDPATAETVLGDFSGVELTHYKITTRMFERDGKYYVHTEGPDGEMRDFRVKYVFGVRPLQQYMVEFDRTDDMPETEIARLQVLPIAWDTEKKRWFYLDPPDVHEQLAPDDRLHWTRAGQNWNRMCADCHSTNLQKNFDADKRQYHTTFSEIDVSCEACHGPGSIHVTLANQRSLFWDRKFGYGLAKLKSKDSKVQVETCARCHVRRHRIVQPNYVPGEPFYDYFANELIRQGAYHADGQILDEVYVYGSFIQSKMYHKGIRCTDCHNPHTTRLKHDGNKLCTSCHAHPAGKYDSPAHHHHQAGSSGASCVECHMPSTHYMEVDPRRDHSLRVPRPDLSVKLGTPNACTACHLPLELEKQGTPAVELPAASAESAAAPEANAEAEPATPRRPRRYAEWLLAANQGDAAAKAELQRVDQWSADRAAEFWGTKIREKPHFSEAIAAAWRGEPNAGEQLERVAKDKTQPGMVRASALLHLRDIDPLALLFDKPTEKSPQTMPPGMLADKDPQVRFVAIGNLETVVASWRQLPDELREEIIEQAIPLLEDPVALVRGEAGRVLAGIPSDALTGPQRLARNQAKELYRQGLASDNDWALSHHSLGLLEERSASGPRDQQHLQDALAAYKRAVRVEPDVTGPRANLSQLLEQLAQTATQQRDIPTAANYSEQAMFYRKEESDLLANEAKLLPDNAFVQYRYGLSLYLIGEEDKAAEVLARAHALEPESVDVLLQLTLLYKKLKRWDEALAAAKDLLALQPQNPTFAHILRETMAEAAADRQRPKAP